MSAFILVFSFCAVLFWVRSAILTLLHSQEAIAEAIEMAEMNRLEFPLVRRSLQEISARNTADYAHLAESLRHDFIALTYLLRFAATVNVGRYSKEEQLLVIDFQIMRAVYNFGRMFSPRLAHYALTEMTSVLEYFANVMCRRMTVYSSQAVGA